MQPARRPPVRLRSYTMAFGLVAFVLILAHAPLLELPFYWDEIGQFVPASLDLFRRGAWIPVSTVPNVHPPGVMAYLALFWKIFGYSIPATRIAMLLIAALGALVTFLLGIELAARGGTSVRPREQDLDRERGAGRKSTPVIYDDLQQGYRVKSCSPFGLRQRGPREFHFGLPGRGSTGTPAFAALALLCISPLFFAQSMLAQLDMPAMCLSILALLLFLQDRFRPSAFVCMLLVMVKETGVVVPALFGCLLLFERGTGKDRARALWFLLPLPALAIWLMTLHHATGHWFGSEAFTAYNLREPLHPVRFLLAFARRLYYLFIGTGHFIGTAALIWALGRMPLLRERPWRIAGCFVLTQVTVVSVLGGAVLERYILPALPVVYIGFAISLGGLSPRTRQLALAALAVCLLAGNFVNPLYPFPFENNLAFASFVGLEESAAGMVEQHGGAFNRGGRVATAFPMSDALRNPDFGFVQTRRNVIEIGNFSLAEVQKLKELAPDMVVVYQRTWDPLHLLDHAAVSSFLSRHYGYLPEMRAEQIAATLSMRVARRWIRRGLSIELLERFPANAAVLDYPRGAAHE